MINDTQQNNKADRSYKENENILEINNEIVRCEVVGKIDNTAE
jgi:hypothetical protein